MDARGEISRKLHRAVKKDTVGVPDGGYALLRIHATNPGLLIVSTCSILVRILPLLVNLRSLIKKFAHRYFRHFP